MAIQWGKILGVLQDPKFWALASAITGIAVGLQTGQLSGPQAETGAVGALAAYMIASGIKAHGEAMAAAPAPAPPPPVVNLTVHPMTSGQSGVTVSSSLPIAASGTGSNAVIAPAITPCPGGR